MFLSRFVEAGATRHDIELAPMSKSQREPSSGVFTSYLTIPPYVLYPIVGPYALINFTKVSEHRFQLRYQRPRAFGTSRLNSVILPTTMTYNVIIAIHILANLGFAIFYTLHYKYHKFHPCRSLCFPCIYTSPSYAFRYTLPSYPRRIVGTDQVRSPGSFNG